MLPISSRIQSGTRNIVLPENHSFSTEEIAPETRKTIDVKDQLDENYIK